MPDSPDALPETLDAIVIGGGAAGIAGAVTLARSRRRVAVLDGGRPRNAASPGVHAVLGHDGIAPAQLLALGRAEVRRYGGVVVAGAVSAVTGELDDFVVSLADGRSARARRLLVATGVRDELPDIPGLAEHWGTGVVHCPYCHGWEVRDQPIAVIATWPMATHQALLFSQLSDDVVLIEGEYPPDAQQRALLRGAGVRTIAAGVTEVTASGGTISGLRLTSGQTLDRSAVVIASRLYAQASFLDGVGLDVVEHASGMATHLQADPVTGRTAVPGVYAAGNVAEPTAQVGASAAAGTMAAAQINAELVMADAAAGAAA